MKLKLSEITIPVGRRDLDEATVLLLMESIKTIGLINPITVDKNGVLIAGAHRLEACRRLGLDEIEVIVLDCDELHAELAEIDENLIRNDLHYTERGDFLKRRKEIYEELHPETKAGNKRATGMNLAVGNNVDEIISPTFVSNTADKIGVSKRTVEQEIQISENLTPEAKQVIREKDVPKTDALKIARMEPEQQKAVVGKYASGEAKSFVDAKRLVVKEQVKDSPKISTDTKYRVIYADPPWQYDNKLTEHYGAAEHHYPTMSISKLCEMPIADLAQDNAVLFLWTTSPLLEEAFAVISAWGFKYKTSFIWDKVRHNMGHYNSVRHEFLLICTKGSCTPENVKLFDSVQVIERTDTHSEKPEEFRNIIETLYPSGKRIELFARKRTEGWTVWGNEI